MYLCTGFQSIMYMHKSHIKATIAFLTAALMTVALIIGSAAALTSCNVTRGVTNEFQYLQRGDTSIVIHTRVTETYDASKKL